MKVEHFQGVETELTPLLEDGYSGYIRPVSGFQERIVYFVTPAQDLFGNENVSVKLGNINVPDARMTFQMLKGELTLGSSGDADNKPVAYSVEEPDMMVVERGTHRDGQTPERRITFVVPDRGIEMHGQLLVVASLGLRVIGEQSKAKVIVWRGSGVVTDLFDASVANSYKLYSLANKGRRRGKRSRPRAE